VKRDRGKLKRRSALDHSTSVDSSMLAHKNFFWNNVFNMTMQTYN